MKIAEFALFADAPVDELARLEAALPRLRKAAGETIYHRGSDANGLYLHEAGTVRFDRATREGTAFTIGFCMPGHQFGELELIAGGARDADAIAVSDCAFRFLSAEIFREHFARSAWFSRNLCVIGNHVRRIQARLYRNVMTLDLSGRIAWWLVSLGQQRVGGGGALKVSQEELAKLIGVSRQSINRHLRCWEEKGWVTIGYGAVTIVDWPAMMAEAQLWPG